MRTRSPLWALAVGLPLGALGQTNYTPYTFTTLAGLVGNAGATNGTGSAARFHSPHGVAVDRQGNVYVADMDNHMIRKITPAGAVRTLAGMAGVSGTNDGVGSAARFKTPWSLAVNSAGTLFVADTSNHTVRVISPSGTVNTLAGMPGVPGSTDGTGRGARFNHPHAVAIDGTGNLYVTDHWNHTIRKITPGDGGGTVSTLAGLAGSPGSANGTGTVARFRYPAGVAVSSTGDVFVSDEYNHAIRKVSSNGVVTTFAGLAGSGNYGFADATGTAARFHNPHGCAVDGADNLYVSEMNNGTVRRITPGGVVTTLAGWPLSAGSANGTGSAVRFSGPRGGAVDSLGNFYLADFGNQTIRKGWPAGMAPLMVLDPPAIAGGDVRIDFTLRTGSSASYQLLQADQLGGPWITNLNAVLATNVVDVSGRFTAPAGGLIQFYRVQAP